MRKLLGPHLAGQWANKLDIVTKWQPPLVTILSPDVDKVRQVRAACPNTIIVGRFYHDDSHYTSNINARPKDFAHEIHNEIMGNPVTPFLDYVQSNNETNQDWQGIQQLNVYTEEWMHLADQSGAYKCAILAFSVGNPDLPNKPGDPAGFDGKMLYWQQVLPSLNYAQQKGHILLMHAYGFPDMFHPFADWYIYRYERQVQDNLRKMGITNLKYMYGEIGIDRYITGVKGGYKSVPTTDRNYVNQHLQWERDQQGQDLLLGGTIFTAGDSGGWDSYDIFSTQAADMIAQHYVDHAGDYNTPSTPEDGGEQIFIPAVGTGPAPVTPTPNPRPPLKWDDRLTQRGIKLTPYVPQPGDSGYWAITEGQYWEEKEHTFAVTLNEKHQRKPGVTMRWWWADGKEDKKTELKPGDRWMIDFAMFAHSCSYNLKVLDAPSDSVHCMGLGSVEQPDWNIHVSYWFEFTWVPLDPSSVPIPTPTPPGPTPVPPTPSGSALVMPCAGVITQRWGENPEDYEKFGIPGHNGLDIANNAGTPILAVADGIVVFVGEDVAYGNYVRVNHPYLGMDSFYAHLKLYDVAFDQRIKQGQKIAEMGSTGNSTGNHLHLEFRLIDIKGNYIALSGGYGKGRIDPEIAYHLLNRTPILRNTLIDIVVDAASEFGVDVRLFDALVREESKYDPHAVSPVGAAGLAQIMPPTFDEWGPKVGATDIFDPRDNARVGAAYLNFLTKYYKGNLRKALHAYNWGPGNVDSGRTPPPETIAYANRILGAQGT